MVDVLLFILLIIGVLIGVVILVLSPILLIAYLANISRRRKQKKTLEQIPKQAEFKVAVRYNKGQQQDELIKIKAFQGSGILYVLDKKIYFRDNLNKNTHDFDSETVKAEWIGINIANGFIKWFKVADNQAEYYFNVETGMFIWHISSKKITTKQVYNKLNALLLD